jgi:hypothetical protein|tara:strand:- start:361 stop:558 length:198 start_codon:yes stop_codon:yes gene_type:complete
MTKTIELKSVGCHIDITGNIYPTLKNGEPDFKNPTPLKECSQEWFDKLEGVDKWCVRFFTPNFYE